MQIKPQVFDFLAFRSLSWSFNSSGLNKWQSTGVVLNCCLDHAVGRGRVAQHGRSVLLGETINSRFATVHSVPRFQEEPATTTKKSAWKSFWDSINEWTRIKRSAVEDEEPTTFSNPVREDKVNRTTEEEDWPEDELDEWNRLNSRSVRFEWRPARGHRIEEGGS